MDTPEAALEAEVQLDSHVLQQRQQRPKSRRGEQAALVVKGGAPSNSSRKGEGTISSTVAQELDDANEETALLPQQTDGEERRSSWAGRADFDGLPWYRVPSIWWILVPFFVMACAFGGIITPKLNLILDLVCREYLSDRELTEPGFIAIPVDFNNGDNDQCRIPEVQSRVAALTTWGNLITGLLSAIISPKLGALSDRYGRKPFLVITSIGTIAGEVITIIAATYAETFPVSWLLLSYALDGLTGSFILSMTVSNAYVTDCTSPERRSIQFGYLHACLFTGVALGPILMGLIVKWTHQIVIVFYMAIVVHVLFVLWVGIVIPESLSKRRREEAHKLHLAETLKTGPERDLINTIRGMNILEPLKILYPTGPGTTPALRRNLIFLAAVDTIVFGVAMGALQVLIIYLNYQFGWKTYESGVFMTIVNSSRVFGLVAVLPLLTYLFGGKGERTAKGCDNFDLGIIRASVAFDTLGFFGYTLARTGAVFTLSGVAASLGGIGSPTLQSALTKHVSPERTGQLLGAIGLLHALARVVSPTVFGFIYYATVGKFTQAVFLCLCATFGLAFLISWFIQPHGKLSRSGDAELRS